MLSFAIPDTVVGVSYVAAFNVPPVVIRSTVGILVIRGSNKAAAQTQRGTFHAGDLAIALAGADGPATVSIRPERIGLRSDGSAEVISAIYLGSRTEYVVETGSSEMLVSRPIWEEPIVAGAAVTIEIHPTDLTRVK